MNRASVKLACLVCFAILMIVAVPASVPAQSKRIRNQAKALEAQAERDYRQQNYREAAEKYGQAIALIPNNPNAHYRKGFAHFNLKEYDPAVSEFTIALNQGFKPLIEVYRVRSYIYYEQKNYDGALDDVQKGLAVEPNDITLVKSLGEIYLAKNAIPEALEAFHKAARMAPNDAEIDYNMARAYSAAENVGGQAAAAEAALAKGTRYPGEAHFLLADAYQKLGRSADAISEYKKAISSKPEIYQAYRSLADMYRNENMHEESIATAKQGLIQFPNDGDLYTDLSWYYSLADRPDDAVQAAKAGITLLPDQYMAYTNLCRAYNETKQYDLAIGACNGALRLKPGDGETYFYLGRAYNLTNRDAEATRYYRLAVTGLLEYTKNFPDYSDAWYLLGNAYFTDNQRDKALDAYVKCLSISPKFAKARYNLGVIYVLKNDKPAAIGQYDRLISLDKRLGDQLKERIDAMKR